MRNPPLPARRHHYEFAHLALPAIIQHHRKKMLGTLVSTHADEFLHQVWEQIAEELPEEEKVDSEGLHCSLYNLDEYAVIIFTMPTPICMTEAHFTSVVFGPFTDIEPDQINSLPYRYFTLEATCDREGNDVGAVMCEWREGDHGNFGSGPEATEEAFLEAIKSIVE